ncbi:MAG TPA: CDP-glucose 4,6-dehydratase, partial [Elusimicrobiales bacterium]|nr:CDP-glucose 4,6-dehydratase [Elusimicrobiales bacterium]
RKCPSLRALLNVTTDKCYENTERARGYREGEPLGGYDPYSNSKACSELVTSAYRSSFFNPEDYTLRPTRRSGALEHGSAHHVAAASARAGNVIGGGDWAADRLIPDIIRAALRGEKVLIRNPRAVRPWQHVLEPLSGYMLLSEKLYRYGPRFAGAWNFGPDAGDAKDVEWLASRMFRKWPLAPGYALDKGRHPHEARYLRLDSSKARRELGWAPRWRVGTAIDRIIEWTLAYSRGEDMLEFCRGQIRDYMRG